MSFYNLPHPWNPGYVIPDYVMAEPPERGTFTTQWLPRGTIDALVPDFLAKRMPMKASAGRKLLGRDDAGLGSLGSGGGGSIGGSSLAGDTLGASEYELQPLGAGASEYPPLVGASQRKVAAYGNQIASQLFAVAKAYPKKQRAAVMKAAMDRIDPALYARCKGIADKLVAQGVPAPTALHHGIAQGVVTGLATQLHQVGTQRIAAARNGRTRTSPQSISPPGLGRDRGMSALGAVNTAFRQSIAGGGQVVTGSRAGVDGVTGNPPQGFTWNVDHWEICKPGCTPIASPYGGATINLATGAVTNLPNDYAKHKLCAVGPFLFQADVDVSCIRLVGVGSTGTSTCDDVTDKNFIDMVPKIKGMIMKQLTTDCSFNVAALAGGVVTSLVSIPVGAMGFFASKPCITSSMVSAAAGTKYGALREFLGGSTPVLDKSGKPTGKTVSVFPNQVNQDYIQLIGVDDDRKQPIIVTKHPVSGKDYGVFMLLQPNHDTGKPWGGTANPVDLIFSFEEMPSGWEGGLVGWIIHLAAEVVDLVGQVVEGVVAATCDLLTSPGLTQALFAGMGKAPSSTTVGTAVGAAVGAAACGGPKLPPAPPLPFLPPFNLMPILLIGGGVLALIAITRSS